MAQRAGGRPRATRTSVAPAAGGAAADGAVSDIPLSRTDWVTAELRRAILRGDLKPGERLLAAELALRWAISQTPLREAYQRLSAEGLVIHTPQRGVRVAPLSTADLEEIYELRLLLEPLALERSLKRADDEWEATVRRRQDELEAWLKANDSFEAPEDIANYEAVHQLFHRALLSRCDSTWLVRIVQMLSDHSGRYRTLSWTPRGGGAEILKEHHDLFRACVKRNIPQAVKLAERHIRITHDVVATELEQHPEYGAGDGNGDDSAQ